MSRLLNNCAGIAQATRGGLELQELPPQDEQYRIDPQWRRAESRLTRCLPPAAFHFRRQEVVPASTRVIRRREPVSLLG